ncbi:hypothetical protein [uncultured Aquimarina sp.]|uniref:hypothetical protein n=1 Tax=uncultured Aquimarina sp. TaxID=575652 RepID=UPI0026113EDF|nr:hypothetical protein [uncultured Aquimarina sp.]
MSWFSFVKIFLILITSLSVKLGEQALPIEKSFIVDSKILSEKISVTTYNVSPDDENIAVVYVTDGQKMIENGALERIKLLTLQKKIPEAYYVFVSTIDVITDVDKRNTYFFVMMIMSASLKKN